MFGAALVTNAGHAAEAWTGVNATATPQKTLIPKKRLIEGVLSAGMGLPVVETFVVVFILVLLVGLLGIVSV